MRRLWVRWVLLVVFVAVLGVVFVNLGEWQLRRLDERQHRNEITIANEKEPVRPFDEVFDRPILDADQWQRVEATGEFDAEHQFVVRFRNNNDQPGYEVVTPLHTDRGSTVLVDRGFIAVPKGNEIPSAAPPPPDGTVTVVGHVRRNEQGRSNAITPIDGQMRLINSDAVTEVLPYDILNGYIGLLTVDPPQGDEFEVVAMPELSDGPHFWYAVQWFMFTGIGVLGIIVFIRGDLRQRRAEQRAAAEGREPPRTTRTRTKDPARRRVTTAPRASDSPPGQDADEG